MPSLRSCLLIAWLGVLVLATPVPAQVLSKTSPEQVGFSPQRLQRLTATFEAYVADSKLAGSVVLVARRGNIAYLHAFGHRDRESKARMPENAVFRIASQTKALVSVGVMILQEQGKLLIGDPVSKFLPEFQKTTVAVAKKDGGYDVVDAKRPITIRHLLTHTAGIGYGEGVARDRWQSAKIQVGTSRTVMSRLAPQSLVWQRSPSMRSPASAMCTAIPPISWEPSLSE